MIARSAVLCVLVLTLRAAEVPRAVGELLTRTAAAEPAEIVRLVDGWDGEPHALLLLARGQARWRLERRAEAEADFRAALVLDASLRPAHLGLAQCAAAREDWLAASRSAAAGIDAQTADAAQLGFLAATATRAGDWRLAALAAQHGILRFPDDERLRRAELAVQVQAGRHEDARQAVLALLARTPQDAGLWRQLAWAAEAGGRADEALAALEAALAAGDSEVRRSLAARQLAAGLPQAALATVRPLMAVASADDALVLLASRAGAEGGDLVQARAWLAAVPEAQRTRAQRIQAARLAVQAGDRAEAAAALDALIAAGEQDGAVLTWAAALADERGDAARAEALYLRASAQPAAALRLVALYLRQGRREDAATTLAAYLLKRPDDAQARAMQARLAPRD